MKIREFVDGYNRCVNQQLKDRFIKDKLEINPYVSIIQKDTYSQIIVNATMYEQEDYEDENGETKRRKTDKIKVNSIVQYIQFCRFVIQLYTNLEIENGGFAEEYDLLKSSGLLDLLMVGYENVPPLIPTEEISEFRTILDLKAKDAMTNSYELHSFISNQIERFGKLANLSLSPILDVLKEKIESIPNEDMDKAVELAKNGGLNEV